MAGFQQARAEWSLQHGEEEGFEMGKRNRDAREERPPRLWAVDIFCEPLPARDAIVSSL